MVCWMDFDSCFAREGFVCLMGKLRWGILATGRIASVFAKGVLGSRLGEVAAVASRRQEEADKFGIEKWGDFLKGRDVRRHGSYEALLADGEVDAVYIATPHPMHAAWAIKCVEAGKHVLVEKPIGMNEGEAAAIFAAAQRQRRFVMEAFMYRCHPLTAKLVETIRSGAIGQVRAMQANFSFNSGTNLTGRLMVNELGGGGILDVGCYCTSMARLVAGAAAGKAEVAEPAEFKAVGKLTETKVDGVAAAVLRFESGMIASIACGVQVMMENVIRVYGSGGSIKLDRWVPADTGNKFVLCQDGKEPQEVAVDAGENVYSLEADVAAEGIGRGELEAAYPAMAWQDSLGNMRALDRWRGEVGVVYAGEA